MAGESIPDYKLPQTDGRVIGPIQHRWSPRAFLDKPVSKQDLHTLFEAARWAASSFNEQPWRFIFATKAEPEAYQRLLSTLLPKNQEWAKGAPVLFITVGRKTFSHNNTPNRYGLHDTGAAMATLAIQAASMGLQIHGMGGFDHDKARTLLKVPHEFEMGAAAAVGYPAPPEMAPEAFQAAEKAPRTRKPLGEIVHHGVFGTAAEF
jgi:nitroreductase